MCILLKLFGLGECKMDQIFNIFSLHKTWRGEIMNERMINWELLKICFFHTEAFASWPPSKGKKGKKVNILLFWVH